MARVTVYHLTTPERLPLIEEDGLRTRADVSDLYGPPGPVDRAAPGTYAHGRRVSAYLSSDHARTRTDEHGPGVVEFTVDPGKAVGVPGPPGDDPEAYWAAARPLGEWLGGGDPPEELEVHQNVPVRAKHLQIRAPLLAEDDLGMYAPLVDAVADQDRLSAKALMHLTIIAADGDFASDAFRAAVALAYRDEPDRDDLLRELTQIGGDKVASAALAEFGAHASDAMRHLRDVLEETRVWADEQGLPHDQGLFVRSAAVLEGLGDAVAGDGPADEERA